MIGGINAANGLAASISPVVGKRYNTISPE